jgi:hypothetical protein
MTKLDLLARIDRLVEQGAVSVQALPEGVRLDDLDDFACAADLFGEATPAIDIELERYVDVQPTGHRRWDSSEDCGEHFIDSGYILD